MVTIVVDSRVRMRIADLPAAVAQAVRDAFSHTNPTHMKLLAMGRRFDHREEPRFIRTWKIEGEWLSVPRGGMGRVREVLTRSGLVWRALDHRTDGELPVGRWKWPKHMPSGQPGSSLFDDQEVAVLAMMKKQNCLLRSGTGCLSGDTIIEFNRAGKSAKTTLAKFVGMFNGAVASGKTWDKAIPTTVRARAADGYVRLVKVRDAYPSGAKQTYVLTTNKGRKIKATGDHRFFTDVGWKRLEDIRPESDQVWVDGGQVTSSKRRSKKKNYLVYGGLEFHPYKTGKRDLSRVPKHRIVAEARMNDLTVNEFLLRIRNGDIGEYLLFIDPKKFTVHHKDEDSRNNAPENLEVVTREAHYKHHGDEGGWKHFTAKTVLELVVSIKKGSFEETFDIEMDGEPNFLANGFVVHNSGKTTSLIALAARLKIPTLILVWTGSLQRQWVERLQSELGMKRSDIGQVGDGKMNLRTITVGMQQTVAKIADPDFFRLWGLVACDEVQRFAAKTFIASIDPFESRYRVGASADEGRKDQKEFLIYDEFGDVAADISEDELIAANRVLDVELRIVPTDFRFAGDVRAPGGYHALLEQMGADAERNALGLSYAAEEVRAGEQVLVFSLRREHCVTLAADLALVHQVSGGLMLGTKPDEEEFERTKAGLKAGGLSAGIGTIQSMGTGVDIPAIARGVVMMPISTNKQLYGQVKGRICRAGKKDARLYYLWDSHVFGDRPVRDLARWAKNVFVLDGRDWVRARHYLKRGKSRETDADFFKSLE